MEDQTNPVFPVDGESGETSPLMADALDGATTEPGDDEESGDETAGDDAFGDEEDTVAMDDGSTGADSVAGGEDDTLSTGLDGGSGDPGDDRAFLTDQAPADLSGATSDGADRSDSDVIAGATSGGGGPEIADGSGPDEDDAESWGADGATSERDESDRADAEALGLGVEDEDDPLDDGATR